MRPSRSAMLLAAGAAVASTIALVVGGVLVLGGDDEVTAPPQAVPTFTTTPLADVEVAGLTVARAAFCDDLDPRQVEAALGGPPASSRSWSSGDRASLSDGVSGTVEDVVHEFGCEYAGADGALARAWVFAPPVTEDRAAELAADRRDGACTATPLTGAPGTEALGEPSSQVTCTGEASTVVGFRGLLGQTWLACEITVPTPATGPAADAAALTDRAGRWCAGVLAAAATSPGTSPRATGGTSSVSPTG